MLRTKLLASVLSLFILVMLATSTLTVLETRRYLTAQLAQDLQSAVARVDDRREVLGTPAPSPAPDRDDKPGSFPGSTAPVLVLGLTPSGQVAVDHRGETLNAVVNTDGLDDTLGPDQITRISSSARVGEEPVRVSMGDDVGGYLVSSRPLAGGGVIYVGVSTDPVDQLLAKLLGVVAVGTAIGLVVAAVGGSVLIRRSLAPLDRVTATARRVSHLKLASGEGAIAEGFKRLAEAEIRTLLPVSAEVAAHRTDFFQP